jgi:hypothetical protein
LELLALFVALLLLLLLLDFFGFVASGSKGRLRWAPSASFSGDEGESLEFVSWVIGLYGGMGLTLPPFFYGKRFVSDFVSSSSFPTTHQFAVVVLAVATILDVVQVIAGLLTQQTQLLRARYVELLLAARLIALHARTSCRLRAFSDVRADVAS